MSATQDESATLFVVGRKTLVAAGHVTTCDTNFFTRVESTNNFCRYQLKRKKGDHCMVAILNYTLANTPLKFFSPIFIQDKRNKFVCIQRIELPLFISIPAGRIKRKLFHSMLPELTSWHIVRYILFDVLFTILQNIILDYVKESCLNICLKINLHKPDADEI